MAATPKVNESKRPKKNRFLKAYSECGNITEACRISGCSRSAYYKWVNDSEFVKQLEIAKEESIERLEKIARERAESTSDTLLIFLLKSLRPKVYRERKEIEHTGGIELTNTEKIIMLIAEERAKVNGNPRLRDIQN